jgi:hypothetical protein
MGLAKKRIGNTEVTNKPVDLQMLTLPICLDESRVGAAQQKVGCSVKSNSGSLTRGLQIVDLRVADR